MEGYNVSARVSIAALALVLVTAVASTTQAQAPVAPASTVQRIVVMRHGEKPAAGLGQLACRGLARAIALPDVIIAKFGAPQFLFAPNPSRRKADSGKMYDYIRPLATLEPLAIRLGLPVDVQVGFDQPLALQRKLALPRYASATMVVAWEHKIAADISRGIVKKFGGDGAQVEAWKFDDFDRLDVIDIKRTPGKPVEIVYTRDKQGLDKISGDCPKAPA